MTHPKTDPTPTMHLDPQDPATMTYGELLRHHRTLRNVSMGDVARAVGVSAAKVSSVELGREPPWSRAITAYVLQRIYPAELYEEHGRHVVERLHVLADQYVAPPPDAEGVPLSHDPPLSHEAHMAAFEREEMTMRIATLEAQVRVLRAGLTDVQSAFAFVAKEMPDCDHLLLPRETFAGLWSDCERFVDRALSTHRLLEQDAPVIPEELAEKTNHRDDDDRLLIVKQLAVTHMGGMLRGRVDQDLARRLRSQLQEEDDDSALAPALRHALSLVEARVDEAYVKTKDTASAFNDALDRYQAQVRQERKAQEP